LHNNSFNTYYNWYWPATTLVTTTKEKVKKRRGDKEEKLITTNPRRILKVPLPKLLVARRPIMLNQDPELARRCLVGC